MHLKIVTGFVLSIFLIAMPYAFAAQKVNIGILTDGPVEGFQQVYALFQKEILTLTDGEFDVEFDPLHQLDGGWSIQKIQGAFKELQQDRDVDMVLALGFVSSLVASRSESLLKPTFAPMVLDSNLLNLPGDGNTSGVTNLNYLSEEVRFTDDVVTFREIVDFNRLALLVDKTVFESVPELALRGSSWAGELGIELVFVLNDSATENLARKIPDNVDAVMVAAIPRLNTTGQQQLIDELIRRRLPSYSLIGTTPVTKGMLAASAPDSDWKRLARKNALNMQAVLLGDNPGDQPVAFRHKRQLTINMKTARQIDIYPRFDVLSTAILLNQDDRSGDIQWSLSAVARESLRSNLDIQSSIAGVNAGSELEQQARSVLRPQLNSTLGVVQLDPDSSSTTTGITAERTSSAALTASQVIYSESSRANVDIQHLAQQVRESAHRALELDIVQQATVGFLNILKAQTLVDLTRRSLSLSRTNLDLAKDRVQLGSVAASDVYRWEIEVANARQSVLDARTQLEQAMDVLNRLLHRPIGERFQTIPASIDDPALMVSHSDLVGIIGNQRSFDRMGELMIVQGKNNSPELKQLDFQIASTERQLVSNRRSYWSPEVSIAGQVDHTIDEDPVLVNSNEGESDWQVALNLSLPLYQGGARRSRVNQSVYELHQLNLQRGAIEERVELLVRQNLHAVQASFPSMDLAQIAADAAGKNLELVQDNYAVGAVSVIDFLDARDEFLIGERNAINAVYDFLIDLMNLQRSTAEFDFFVDPEEMQRTVDEIKRYVLSP
jgi:outer membrane protein TolC/ABC-type uncharacterized transport system substrate-binding protein